MMSNLNRNTVALIAGTALGFAAVFLPLRFFDFATQKIELFVALFITTTIVSLFEREVMKRAKARLEILSDASGMTRLKATLSRPEIYFDFGIPVGSALALAMAFFGTHVSEHS